MKGGFISFALGFIFVFQIAYSVTAEEMENNFDRIYISGYPDDFYLSYPALPVFTPLYKNNNITLIFREAYTRAIIYVNGELYVPSSPFMVEITNFYGVGTPFILHVLELLTGVYALPIIGGLTFVGVGNVVISPL